MKKALACIICGLAFCTSSAADTPKVQSDAFFTIVWPSGFYTDAEVAKYTKPDRMWNCTGTEGYDMQGIAFKPAGCIETIYYKPGIANFLYDERDVMRVVTDIAIARGKTPPIFPKQTNDTTVHNGAWGNDEEEEQQDDGDHVNACNGTIQLWNYRILIIRAEVKIICAGNFHRISNTLSVSLIPKDPSQHWARLVSSWKTQNKAVMDHRLKAPCLRGKALYGVHVAAIGYYYDDHEFERSAPWFRVRPYEMECFPDRIGDKVKPKPNERPPIHD